MYKNTDWLCNQKEKKKEKIHKHYKGINGLKKEETKYWTETSLLGIHYNALLFFSLKI